MCKDHLTYNDFRSRLTTLDALKDTGYHLNRRNWLRYPDYVRLDSNGARSEVISLLLLDNIKYFV